MFLGVVMATTLAGTSGFCDGARCTDAPWSQSEIVGTAGVFTAGYAHRTGAVAQPFGTLGVEMRFRPAPRGTFIDRLILEEGIVGVAPFAGEGASGGARGILRVGLGWAGFAFTVGVNAQFDATPAPAVILPSFAVTWRPGAFAITAAVLDRPVGPIARVTLEFGSWGFGYAAPIGGDIFTRFRIADSAALEFRAFAYQLFNSFAAGASVGVVWGRASVYRFRTDAR